MIKSSQQEKKKKTSAKKNDKKKLKIGNREVAREKQSVFSDAFLLYLFSCLFFFLRSSCKCLDVTMQQWD